MKILKLQAENFKKLSVVEITPKGNLIQITGKNMSGKSSVLDSIWATLAGKVAVPGKAIRKGQKKAHVKLDLGEVIVTRSFTQKDSYLTVESAEGSRHKEPQQMLDDLLGEFSFDPLRFSRQSNMAQYEAIREIANIDVDLDELDAANQADYERRTELNRQAKSFQAQAEGIELPDDLPGERIDTIALTDGLVKAGEHNAYIEQQRRDRTELENTISALKDEEVATLGKIKELEARIYEFHVNLQDNVKAKRSECRMQLEKLEGFALEPTSTAALREEMAAAEDINELIRERGQKNEALALALSADKAAKELTKKIDLRKNQKAEAIARADMPIKGMSLEEGRVVFNGIPFDQCSSAEQLRVSVAIAMAINPKLRVIRLEEGSLLDEDHLKIIAEMAQEKDYQVWIERVDDSGKVGIVMEDGMVKADHQAVQEELIP